VVLLLAPPHPPRGSRGGLWFGVTLFALFFFWTAVYALVPSLCSLAGLAIALGRAEHEAVLAAIEARRAGRSASDPLIAPTTAS
jgi:hypothetical protein